MLLLDARTRRCCRCPAAWLDATAELRSFAGAADAEGDGVGCRRSSLVRCCRWRRCISTRRALDSGDIALSWVRRSRADTDSWAGDDAPLDFAPEAYRLTIFNGVHAGADDRSCRRPR